MKKELLDKRNKQKFWFCVNYCIYYLFFFQKNSRNRIILFDSLFYLLVIKSFFSTFSTTLASKLQIQSINKLLLTWMSLSIF